MRLRDTGKRRPKGSKAQDPRSRAAAPPRVAISGNRIDAQNIEAVMKGMGLSLISLALFASCTAEAQQRRIQYPETRTI
jgi:hypothetical protein